MLTFLIFANSCPPSPVFPDRPLKKSSDEKATLGQIFFSKALPFAGYPQSLVRVLLYYHSQQF